ncbi:ATP-binding protein [Ramlibacter sp. MAHUQ-53]|uniref:ATP-binding protein n=1 Tax=unclassified Ramlibacter TaxID=2617605 RepID=UPI003629E7C2
MNASTLPPSAPFRRDLRSRVGEFDALARSLTAWGETQGVSARAMQGVVLILDELFANVVMHGYRDDPDGDVAIEAMLVDGQVQVTLTDHAPHFNPLEVDEPDISLDLEEREIGGLGLLFVRRTADALAYESLDAQGRPANVLRYAKRVA